jgi:aspartyl-tRNA(Asn)/glutamyl-tRNA(Gln) amidotransferase subunit C
MTVTRDEVEHVARLAHIALQPHEIEEMTEQLSSILDHVGRLQALDTMGVPAMAHTVPTTDVMREDVARPSWPPELVLANAPHRFEDFFEVQAILD